MQKKLTITVDEQVYAGLYRVVGKRKISKFIENLVRSYVLKENLDAAYKEMGNDAERERDAMECIEGGIGESISETW